jgi:adenylate kinase
MLSHCLGLPHVSTGDILRDRVRSGAVAGTAAAMMQSGALVSDEVVNVLVEERLEQPDAVRGFILDGYPRTVPQAQHLAGWLEDRGKRELVLFLIVDYNIIIGRLTGRRQCPRCGTLYNLVFQPPREDSVCDLDGEVLMVRDDDRESVIRERLEAYERQTEPVLDFYREAGRRIVRVDGDNDPPQVVFERICQAMEADDRSENRR